jgi:hypothetical protein
MNTEPPTFKVGDGVTILHYSDRTTATVVKVSKSGRTIWTQDDCASLDPPHWKPQFAPGGFAGHCTNQHEQRYIYHRDPFGRERRASLRKNGQWHLTSGERIVPGRSKFHDYNF